MENFSNISVTQEDSAEINHLSFYGDNPELLFAASSENIKLWNVESNKLLDCLSLPPKTVTDMKISPESGDHGLLLVSAIHKESVNIYFQHLNLINFDESIDMLPSKNDERPVDPAPREDVMMRDENNENNVTRNTTYV
jgi:WD40 repeat protein